MPESNDINLNHRSWNPLRGCSRVSTGCQNCYAERFAYRLSEPGQPYEGLVKLTKDGPRWTGQIRLVHELLTEPLRWRKPAFVFVNSMSDVFHKDVPDSFIAQIFDTMRDCYWHLFFILTRRPERMQHWVSDWYAEQNITRPLENLWLGTSVEDQAAANQRMPFITQTPAAVRFICCEPLLSAIDLSNWLLKDDRAMLDYIVVGAESGLGARPMDDDWVRQLRDQALMAQIPFCFKQRAIKGRQISRPELDGVVWNQQPSLPSQILKRLVQSRKTQKPSASAQQLSFDFG